MKLLNLKVVLLFLITLFNFAKSGKGKKQDLIYRYHCYLGHRWLVTVDGEILFLFTPRLPTHNHYHTEIYKKPNRRAKVKGKCGEKKHVRWDNRRRKQYKIIKSKKVLGNFVLGETPLQKKSRTLNPDYTLTVDFKLKRGIKGVKIYWIDHRGTVIDFSKLRYNFTMTEEMADQLFHNDLNQDKEFIQGNTQPCFYPGPWCDQNLVPCKCNHGTPLWKTCWDNQYEYCGKCPAGRNNYYWSNDLGLACNLDSETNFGNNALIGEE